jgi:hypothetical protein
MRISAHGLALGISLCSLVCSTGTVFASSLNEIDDSILTTTTQATASAWAAQISGTITDSEGQPVAKAALVIDGKEYLTDEQGTFQIEITSSQSPLLIKKPGFRKVLVGPSSDRLDIQLETATVNAIYVPWSVLSNSASQPGILALLQNTELNAIVVDVKDDTGKLHSGLKAGVDFLHSHGIYSIGRVVSFKDSAYSKAHPEFALTKTDGGLWADHSKNTYLNPFNEGAQNYIVGVAKNAADAGFDEIQFDYVRFPVDGDLSTVAWSKPYTAESRTDAIGDFVESARKVLGPMGAFVAADLFGIAGAEQNDLSKEGQNVEKIAAWADYICPMVYPSGYSKNTGGFPVPTDHPQEIVESAVHRFRLRSDEAVVRPWLQAFRDYAFNHRDYGPDEINEQIDGSDAAGGQGYLLWNSSGHYPATGLRQKKHRVRGSSVGLLLN